MATDAREREDTAAYHLGRACACFSWASTLLREDYKAGKYGEDHYEALEEELARISKDTLHLARTLGWMIKSGTTEGQRGEK